MPPHVVRAPHSVQLPDGVQQSVTQFTLQMLSIHPSLVGFFVGWTDGPPFVEAKSLILLGLGRRAPAWAPEEPR